MKSIKTKIVIMAVGCILFACTAIGLLSVQNSREVISKNTTQIMNEACENRTAEINSYLSSIEQSVDTLADFTLSSITDLDKFKTSSQYVTEITNNVENYLSTSAYHTEGAIAAYIRYNPDFTEPTSGLFMTRNSTEEKFQSLTPTDFSTFDKNDLAHVGWYYIPVNNGKPTWMSPYLNENIGVYMISYVVPLFKDGENIGIVGIDIDFTKVESIVAEPSVYESSLLFLLSDDKKIMYHPEIEFGTALDTLNEDGRICGLSDAVEAESSEEQLISITQSGKSCGAVFSGLKCGMKLVMTAEYTEIKANANYLLLFVCGIGVIVAILAAIIALIVASRITKPLKNLNTAAQQIADGNLDVKIENHSKDEVGKLATSISLTAERLHDYINYISEISDTLNSIAEGNLDITLTKEYAGEFSKIKESLDNISSSLNDTMHEINSAAEQVAVGSSQVASGAQALAQTSTEQAASVQELSDYVDTLTERIKKNTQDAEDAFEIFEKVAEGMAQSSNNMTEMTDAMSAITEASQKISNIVQTVDGIAEQTNILAINAAIEAARAGDAGKGFAVVAGEIQTLAAKTASATSEISNLVENVLRTVGNGTEITAKTDSSIKESAKASQIIEERLKAIVDSSEKQAHAVENVNKGIKQISNAVQTNSATAEESAASSEEMSGQARLLRERISGFKLKEN